MSDRKPLVPLRSESLAEQAYRSIRESVITGEFVAGERLVETRLSEELGISRAPIREALGRLKDEGLVFERPRHGTFVRGFTAKDLVDIYNLRLAIETAAVRLFVRRGASTEPLERLVNEMDEAARAEDIGGVVQAELRFHEVLCGGSGNEYLATVFHSLAGQVRMALSLDDEIYPDLADVATEHVPLIESIRAGDEAATAATLQDHILSTVGDALKRLGGDPTDLLRPLERGGGPD